MEDIQSITFFGINITICGNNNGRNHGGGRKNIVFILTNLCNPVDGRDKVYQKWSFKSIPLLGE